jgi:hypothetical protein
MPVLGMLSQCGAVSSLRSEVLGSSQLYGCVHCVDKILFHKAEYFWVLQLIFAFLGF